MSTTIIYGMTSFLETLEGIAAVCTIIVPSTTFVVWLYRRRKSHSIVKPQVNQMEQSTRESKLDDLINEIESFVYRREQSKFPNSSYKSLIKMNGLDGQKREIRQHAREIRRKIEPLQRLMVSQFQRPIDVANWTTNRMIALDAETERIFQSFNKAKAFFLSNPDKLTTLIDEGDDICKSWRYVVEQLEKLSLLL